jgi:NAD(P)-dependent dehydrogenase (short-subunit alcohol dehydrogenase family)
MVAVLIIGATRGLGAALANAYASDVQNAVYGTTRSSSAPRGDSILPSVNWVTNVDLMDPNVGLALVDQLGLLGVGNGMVEGEGSFKGFDVVVRIGAKNEWVLEDLAIGWSGGNERGRGGNNIWSATDD